MTVTESTRRPRALDKKRAALVVLVPAALLLGLTTRIWARGESRDVLSQAVTEVTGGAAAPGVVGLTAVCVVALRPVGTVADAVARELARTTAPAATGSSTAWVWAAVVVAALLAVGALLTAVSSRSWAGLSGRYERGDKPASGPRGEVRTTWDELSEGGDPTLRDAPDET
jgi:hypothetical protein